MFLIYCPECGKGNIPDSTTVCPFCGYEIKEHFEILKRKGVLPNGLQGEQIKLRKELEERLDEIDRMARPNKPTWIGTSLNGQNWGFYVFLSLTLFITGFILHMLIVEHAFSIWWIIFLVPYAAGTKFWIDRVTINHREELDDHKNWDKYKEKLKLRAEISYQCKLDDLSKPIIIKSTYDDEIRCPRCGSTAITTGARGVNHFWGFIGASKTVNRCAKCGHMWTPKG